MSVLTILFILFVVFILVPVIRVALFIYNARRQANNIFEQFARESERYVTQSPQQSPAAAPKPKKIASDVGEYVEFEEIAVTEKSTYQTDGTTETFEADTQIVDVEWKDLPEK